MENVIIPTEKWICNNIRCSGVIITAVEAEENLENYSWTIVGATGKLVPRCPKCKKTMLYIDKE